MDPQDIGKKTSYTLFDEVAEKTTITLEKYIADILHMIFPNVHGWIQKAFSEVSAMHPHLTRMQKGNAVRELALVVVKDTPLYEQYMSDLLNSL